MTDAICQNCGKEVDSGAVFCGNCGTDIQAHIVTQQKASPGIAPPMGKISGNSTIQFKPSSTSVPSAPSTIRTNNTRQRILHSSQKNASLPLAMHRQARMSVVKECGKFILGMLLNPIVIGILVGGLFIGSLIYSDHQMDMPEYGLQQYCDHLKGAPDYNAAYSLLGTKDSGRSILSKDQFVARVKAITQPLDGIGDCTVAIKNQYGEIAHGTITYEYGDGKTSTEPYEVFHAGYQNWKIEVKDWTVTTAPVA